MRIVKHDRKPNYNEIHLTVVPLVVWLSPLEELIVDRGDTLLEVAKTIHGRWSLSKKSCRELVAFWFALGERISRGDERVAGWNDQELSISLKRRYNPSIH